jgi:hypothetical protein
VGWAPLARLADDLVELLATALCVGAEKSCFAMVV